MARYVAHVGAGVGREVRADLGDLAAGEGHVGDAVEILRGVDDPPALEDEIERHKIPSRH